MLSSEKRGFTRCIKDPGVYLKEKGAEESISLLLYVDDMLIAVKDKKKVSKLKEILKKEFEMKDLGPATRILGMDITIDREKGILKLSQERYVKQVLKDFRNGR